MMHGTYSFKLIDALIKVDKLGLRDYTDVRAALPVYR